MGQRTLIPKGLGVLFVAAAALATASVPACGGSDEGSGLCTGSRAFPINAVNDDSRAPIPRPIVVFEPNGLSAPSPSPKGAMTFGGEGDANGLISPPLPCGRWGVHVFATGYRCQSAERGNTGALEMGLVPQQPNDAVPLLVQATWSDAAPKPGDEATITVTTAAASTAAEDKVTAVTMSSTSNTNYRAISLTEITMGDGGDGVTQTWQGKLLLPGAAGDLIYAVVGATEDCRSTKVLRLPITLRR